MNSDSGAGDEDLTALRRDLCRSLRRHREATGLSQVRAAAELGWSESKFVRIELGTTSVSVTDVQAMLRLYGIYHADEVARLEAAARRTWLKPGIGRKRLPFASLMERVAAACPADAEELAAQWEESPQRVADAIEAVRVLRTGSLAEPQDYSPVTP